MTSAMTVKITQRHISKTIDIIILYLYRIKQQHNGDFVKFNLERHLYHDI